MKKDKKAKKQAPADAEQAVEVDAGTETILEEQPDVTATDETIEIADELAAEAAADTGEADEGDAFVELQNRLLRLQADFDNFRKRTRREKEVWSRQAQESIVMELLTVLDHFELGLQNAEVNETQKGFQMIFDQFAGALKKFNVNPVLAEGEVFNPELHEAISQLPSDEHAADQVVAQTRKGYVMGDKLLRPAQVVVSQGPGKAAEAEAEAKAETAEEGETTDVES